MNHIRPPESSERHALLVLRTIIFLSLYLPNTWSISTASQDYAISLEEISKHINVQEFRIDSVVDGTSRIPAESRTVRWTWTSWEQRNLASTVVPGAALRLWVCGHVSGTC